MFSRVMSVHQVTQAEFANLSKLSEFHTNPFKDKDHHGAFIRKLECTRDDVARAGKMTKPKQENHDEKTNLQSQMFGCLSNFAIW
jgi:hypothetical protein